MMKHIKEYNNFKWDDFDEEEEEDPTFPDIIEYGKTIDYYKRFIGKECRIKKDSEYFTQNHNYDHIAFICEIINIKSQSYRYRDIDFIFEIKWYKKDDYISNDNSVVGLQSFDRNSYRCMDLELI